MSRNCRLCGLAHTVSNRCEAVHCHYLRRGRAVIVQITLADESREASLPKTATATATATAAATSTATSTATATTITIAAATAIAAKAIQEALAVVRTFAHQLLCDTTHPTTTRHPLAPSCQK